MLLLILTTVFFVCVCVCVCVCAPGSRLRPGCGQLSDPTPPALGRPGQSGGPPLPRLPLSQFRPLSLTPPSCARAELPQVSEGRGLGEALLAWKISWTEEPGELLSMGLHTRGLGCMLLMRSIQKPSAHLPGPWKNRLPHNWSLVPKRLGTADVN